MYEVYRDKAVVYSDMEIEEVDHFTHKGVEE